MAPSTYTPIADRTAGRTAWTSSRSRGWRRRRGSTSAATKRTTTCASPIREAWATLRRPPRGYGDSDGLFLRLLPERFQARLLGEHLDCILRGRLVESAAVHLQRGLGVPQAPLVFAQDPAADHYVDVGVEQRLLAAVVRQLLEVVLLDHLHQPLGAQRALCHGVVARLDRHHGKDEQGIEGVFAAGAVGGGNEAGDRLVGNPVAPGDIFGHRPLLAGAVDRTRLDEPGGGRRGKRLFRDDEGGERRKGLQQRFPRRRHKSEAAERGEADQPQGAIERRISSGSRKGHRVHVQPPCFLGRSLLLWTWRRPGRMLVS